MNFRVVDGNRDYLDLLPNFIKLYNDPDIKAKDIPFLLDINQKEYLNLRKEAISEGLLNLRYPLREKKRKVRVPSYVYRSGYRWEIHKRVGGDNLYFGSYEKRDDALRIVELLKECGWDKSQLERIKREVLDG